MTGPSQPDRRLRLLVLASADVIHTRRWVRYFRSRGHEVALATLEPSGRQDFDEIVLPTRSLRPSLLRYTLAAPAVAGLVKRFRPDLVNAHYVPGYGFLAALVRPARPLAVSCWGSDILVNAGQSPLHRARASFVLRAARLFTCDAGVLGGALRSLGVDPERIVTTPMGVDREVFNVRGRVSEPPVSCPRDRGRPFRIVSTRRMEPVYCVETLLRAALIMREAGWNFSLSFVGDGSERESLERFAGYYSLNDRLDGFRGWLDPSRMADELRASDIYVSCSRSDGSSVSLLEAMACGAFPVVSDIEGNREWVRDGVNGLLFPVGDSGALSERLIRAMMDPELREKACRKNLQLVERRAVWESNMSVVEKRFVELVGVQSSSLPPGRQKGQKPVLRS